MNGSTVSIVEHKSSGTVGIVVLSSFSPRLTLIQMHDTIHYNETIAQLYFHSPIHTLLLCSSNEGSLLSAKLRRHFPSSAIQYLPRSEFSENVGAALLRTLASPASEQLSWDGPAAVGASFLSLAAAAAVLRHVASGERGGFAPGTLLVESSSGAGHVTIDVTTVSRLELVSSAAAGVTGGGGGGGSGGKRMRTGSLLGSIDYTKTSAGGRLLAANVVRPFTDGGTICERLDAVDELLESEERFFDIVEFVKRVGAAGVDFEQIARSIVIINTDYQSSQQQIQSQLSLMDANSSNNTSNRGKKGMPAKASFVQTRNQPKQQQKSSPSKIKSSASSSSSSAESQLRKVISLYDALGHLGVGAERALRGCRCALLARIRENLLHPALASVRQEIEKVLSPGAIRGGRRLSKGELGFAVREGIDPFLDIARAEYAETAEDLAKLVAEYKGVLPAVTLRRNERAQQYYLECPAGGDDPSKVAPALFIDSVFIKRDAPQSPKRKRGDRNAPGRPAKSNLAGLSAGDKSGDGNGGVNGGVNGGIGGNQWKCGGRWTFTTREVDSLSRKNADAMERVLTFSARVIGDLLGRLRSTAVTPLVLAGEAVAHLDVLQSFATYATLNSPTVRPEFTPDGPIAIKQGRHPILDSNGANGSGSGGSGFIPNDTFLGPSGVQIVTGPNMSGKSTYIRQVALLSVMAQIGSRVPAEFASFRIVSRIMSCIPPSISSNTTNITSVTNNAINTEVVNNDNTDTVNGAGETGGGVSVAYDGNNGGGSFAAELRDIRAVLVAAGEAAQRRGEATLVVVDEFGRSTAPLGGRALAWAVAERLARTQGVLCLFVTHFRDVAEGLVEGYPAVVAARHFAVERHGGSSGKDGGGGSCAGDKFRPLFALSAGVSRDSLGVETAEMCGLPGDLVGMAREFRGELKRGREAEKRERMKRKQPGFEGESEELSQAQVLLAKRLWGLKNSTLGLDEVTKLLDSIKSTI